MSLDWIWWPLSTFMAPSFSSNFYQSLLSSFFSLSWFVSLYVSPSICLVVSLSVYWPINSSIHQSVGQSLCWSICLSVHQSSSPSVFQYISLPVHQSSSPSVHWSIFLSVCQSISLLFHWSVSPSVSRCVNLSASWSVCLSTVHPIICQYICLCAYLSVCMPVCPSFFLPFYLYMCSSLCMHVCPSFHFFIHLSVSLFVTNDQSWNTEGRVWGYTNLHHVISLVFSETAYLIKVNCTVLSSFSQWKILKNVFSKLSSGKVQRTGFPRTAFEVLKISANLWINHGISGLFWVI